MPQVISDFYTSKRDFSAQKISRYNTLINRCSAYRLILLICGIIMFYCSLAPDRFWLPVITFFLFLLGFSFLVRAQNQFQRKLNYYKTLTVIVDNELSSLKRGDSIYSEGRDWIDDSHPYTSDLDIFGSSSLFKLVNRCSTEFGMATLANWLMNPADGKEIRIRQEAVRELGSEIDWLHNFQVNLFSADKTVSQIELLSYFQTASVNLPQFLKFYLHWIPWFFLTAAILAGIYPIVCLAIIALGIGNMILVQFYSAQILKTDQRVSKIKFFLGRYSNAIREFNSRNWESRLCSSIKSELQNPERGNLPAQLSQLSVCINNLNLGLSTIGPILNFIMAWNVRQLFSIEKWRFSNQGTLQFAFEKIGEIEAHVSLSTLYSNYKSWEFPEIQDHSHFTIEGKDMGHPLIADRSRIVNNYSFTDTRYIDIITGSNMAGKSTFLRTLGINVVLGLAGAPVCAKNLKLSVFKIFSYMRIRDSLNENTSTFKAELNRLQELLELVVRGEKIYFLIDEMLRGTNSVDKYQGSKAVIEKLVSYHGAGVIATHDLQLSELERVYPENIRNFHFDISMNGDEMIFDYKLKPGACNTFNAKTLLKGLGIEI